MCLSTLLYYPRTHLTGCGSFPMYEDVNSTDVMAAVNTIKSWDWTKPSVRSQFRSVLEHSDNSFFCSGPTIKHSVSVLCLKQ